VAGFLARQRSLSAVPTIKALRKHFYAVRDAELLRREGKLAALSPEDYARFEDVTRLMIERLLLDPTDQLKALPDEETQIAYAEMLNRLFRLSPHHNVDEDVPGPRAKPRRP
jgi:glutamyl-tRNA reductase